MTVLYKKMVFKRYVFYPFVIGLLSYYLYSLIQDTHVGILFNELGPLSHLEKTFGVELPFEQFQYFYFYLVGFVYGTMSMLLPIHKLGLGIIGLILMYLKWFLSMFAFAPLALMVIPVELMVVVLYTLLKKTTQKKKEDNLYMKGQDHYTLKELKEWVINETS